jgi:riboflavin kinase / FMN adenylyltransferase
MTTQRVIQGLDDLPEAILGGVLCIGNFDGVHRGHQALLTQAHELAVPEGLPVIAMTFDPPPDLVIRPDDDPRRLTPLSVKTGRLIETGVDVVVVVTPDKAFLSQSPASFVENVIGKLAPRHVVEGPNFHFGKGRKGDVELLATLGVDAGFDVTVVDPVKVELAGEQRCVSSTVIRELVLAGDVASAATCLYQPFALFGVVEVGRGIGRQLGVPTVNIQSPGQVLPADGVYAGWAEVGGDRHPAAIVVTDSPTIPGGRHLIEAHLLDASGDFYGQPVALWFVEHVRGIERFDSTDELVTQIHKDIACVRAICEC